MKKSVPVIILSCLILTVKSFAQNGEKPFNPVSMKDFIKRVATNSTRNTEAFFQNYQHSFRVTIESENKKSSNAFEQYCLNGKPFCETVQIEKNGVPVKLSKIEKAREKAAERLVKLDIEKKAVSSGAGINLGQTYINPISYLTYCPVKMMSEKIINNRAAISIFVNDCNIDNLSDNYKKHITFIAETKAEILIDKSD